MWWVNRKLEAENTEWKESAAIGESSYPNSFLSSELRLAGLITQFQGTGWILKTNNFFPVSSNLLDVYLQTILLSFFFFLLITMEVKILWHSSSALLYGILNLKSRFSLLGHLLLLFHLITLHCEFLLFYPACKNVLEEQSCPSPSLQKSHFPPKIFHVATSLSSQ